MTVDLSRAETLPASLYADPAVWLEERRAIFGREWLCVGHEQNLAGPGDYLAMDLAGWPIFVVRDREGLIRGFHNVCRHRAGPIVWDGIGHTDVLRCRYHGWVYDTKGSLRRTPDFGEAAGFDRADYGLFGIRAETWRGLVFVNLDEAAPPLTDSLGTLSDEAAPYPMEDYRFHSRVTHDIRCNWKAYVDNYMEGYHVKALHPGLDRQIDSDAYEVIVRDGYAVHRAPQRRGAAYSGLWVWRWPNLGLNLYANGMNVEMMMPIGHDRTRLIYNFFFSDLSDEAGIAASIAASSEVTAEDVHICEAVQRNLDAGLYDTGRLSPRQENGVFDFHQRVRRSLRSNRS